MRELISELSDQEYSVSLAHDNTARASTLYDEKKLARFMAEIGRGLDNYLLFQRCPGYLWPYWVSSSINCDSSSFDPVSFPILINDRHRDWIRTSNLLSSETLLIDRRGMISVSYDRWSLETWILNGSDITRPQDTGTVIQKRDPRTTVVGTQWKTGDVELKFQVYGNKSTINECVVDFSVILRKAVSDCSLLIVIRPYGNLTLGGVGRIEFRKDTRVVKINGLDRLHFPAVPAFILVGNAGSGDCDPRGPSSSSMKVSCPDGMATLAAGFNLKKGENRLSLRIGLSADKGIQPAKLDTAQIRENFASFAAMRTDRGFKTSFPDRDVQKWVYGSKGAMLNCLHRPLDPGGFPSIREAREQYYISIACNRMGFFPESERMLVQMLDRFQQPGDAAFDHSISAAYCLICFADFFVHSRELDFLQKQFPRLRNAAQLLFNYCRGVKSLSLLTKESVNSIENNLTKENHLFDMIILLYAMAQYSYCARCIGIFGEELKFNEEAARLGAVMVTELKSLGIEAGDMAPGVRSGRGKLLRKILKEKNADSMGKGKPAIDEFFAYLLYAAAPFRCDVFDPGMHRQVLENCDRIYDGIPLYGRSLGGWDVPLSLVHSLSLMIQGDPRYYDTLSRFFEAGGDRIVLPSCLNPRTGMGVRGEGDSPAAMSLLFVVLRSMIFMDLEDNLSIFPCPREEWFRPGNEITVEDAPSRFGPVNFKMTASSNEVLIRFTQLPKFTPPEIRFHLPFKAKIKDDSDFIIKKAQGNAYTINGWPSAVRFIKQ